MLRKMLTPNYGCDCTGIYFTNWADDSAGGLCPRCHLSPISLS